MVSFQKILDGVSNSTKYKNYNNSYKNFQAEFKDFINRLTIKLKNLTIKNVSFSVESGTLQLQDNTVFKYSGKSGVSNLKITYPDTDFISTILFSTAKSGQIRIEFPKDSVFVGRKKLDFFPQETWELNIHNKRIVAVQIFENK